MKTSELTGAALDWAVALSELMSGQDYTLAIDDDGLIKRVNFGGMYPEWSSDWQEGGPIIDRTGICLSSDHEDAGDGWIAYMPARGSCIWGDTALVAAMRCYVASKLGDEVDVPEELMEVA